MRADFGFRMTGGDLVEVAGPSSGTVRIAAHGPWKYMLAVGINGTEYVALFASIRTALNVVLTTTDRISRTRSYQRYPRAL